MKDKEAIVIDDEFDFGFSVVDRDELEVVQEAHRETEEWECKSRAIIKMIMPLLDNLAANPEKDYIYWPNRTEKIEEFKRKLLREIE